MEAAAEIHRYHRDVTDLLSRIHSHYRIVPQDLGNNLNHVKDLVKKHDKIESELLGLEAQVHLLLTDSQRLQETYPGGNEEHIQMQLALVIENWNLLQQKVSNRKIQLLAAQRIHEFLSKVREEEIWSKEICLDLESNIVPRDAQQLEKDYQLLGGEIETRLNCFEPLIEDGKSLLSYDIFQPQIEEKLKSLSDIRTRVKEAWNRRGVFIQQKKDVFAFFHEAKQIQASFTRREVQLCGSENKETVEDISNALKKQLEFQKSMETQEEKFTNWMQQGENLLKIHVEESPKIEKKMNDLSERRKRLIVFSSERSKSLSEALKQATFKRDTIEAEAWIQEKKNRFRLVFKDYNQLSDEEKIKCLQKQQAAQAELDAHEPFIENIVQQSKELVSGPEVQTRLQLILEDWEEVKENASRMSSDLLQAKDMLLIHDLFEKTEAWIKQKELMIQANEVGKDYEHCLSLQAKLDDAHSDTKVDESLLKQMRDLSIKLTRNEDQKGVYVRYERICERWNWLNEEIVLYRKKLKDAAQIHAFIKDVDDTIERIREKTLVLSTREEATEIRTAQMMKRKLEMVEGDLTALNNKIKEQETEAQFLAEQHQLSAGRISDKMSQVHREWAALDKELIAKRQYIDSTYTCLKFIKDANDFAIVVHELVAEMEFGPVPSNSADGQSLLRAHNDHQSEISSRHREIKALQESGRQILRLPDVSTKGIENSLRSLEEMSSDLDQVWQNRLEILLQCRDLQLFLEKAKQVENWLSAKEAFLANHDIGDSLSSVEALIRKHEHFEELCLATYEKIREVEMMAKDHGDSEVIQSRCEDICRRRDVLQESCRRRKAILQDARALQQLLLEMYEISNWMSEKIRVASDDSYRDLTNLLSKTQKHAAFEAEILANHSRVKDFTNQAEKLIQQDHFASVEIRQHVENMENLWERLINASNFRKERLQEAYEALQFKHKLEDINTWLEETEAQIEFEDYDSSAAALQQEMNKHQELENEAEEYSQNLRLLSDVTEEFQRTNHFSKDEIVSRFKTTINRFHIVEDNLLSKRNKLQESLLMAEVDNDINDELSWIEENVKVCESDQHFSDILSVHALQKKLQALETEIVSREPLISSVVDRGRRSNNDMAMSKVQHLEDRFQVLKDTVSLRRLRLADALEAQTYYFEATQAEMWMKEKLAQVIGYDIERDIYSVQSIQKKLSTIDAATEGFRQSIETLQEHSSDLIQRNHFDSNNIQVKQMEVNDLYEELRQNILKKTAILREKEDYFLYERDVKDLVTQLKAMTNVANSTDYGRDVEHVESLLQKFEVFGNRLHNHESHVQELQQQGNCFLEEGHTETENVQETLKELEDVWLKCKESADLRCKILEQEKLVHSFYKSADETISWIHEKDVTLSSEDYGHDLESIKTLLKHHDTLEGDLKAIEEQVQALAEEGVLLSTQFPDSKEDIEAKHQLVQNSWQKCTEKALNRKDKLIQSEQLQSYFEESRDFQSWIYEMSALIKSSELPEDVAACEALLVQHDEYKSEIDTQVRSFDIFAGRGNEIIASGHFLSQDVRTKLDSLNTSLHDLLNTWESRRQIYEQNLDLQLFKKKLIELDTWLNTQEHNLAEENGHSVEEVDYLIQKLEQFEKKMELYEAKFQKLVQSTKLEDAVLRKREEDEKNRMEEEKNLEQQKFEEIRRKEEERILEERKKERVQSELAHKYESDDDYLPPLDSLPSEEYVFRRIDSIRKSYKEQPDSARASSPVIQGNKLINSYIQPPEPPTTKAEGFLSRKQELYSGGKRSTSRQWKSLYTVLCGHLLCFFKDKKSFLDSNSSKPPVNILKARCYIPKDYHKKKYVFRLELSDHSAFLFEAPNDIKRDEWIKKINFTASLSPSKQLLTSIEEQKLTVATEEVKNSTLPNEEELYAIPGSVRLREDDDEKHDNIVSSSRSPSDPIVSGYHDDGYNVYDDPFEGTVRSFSLDSYETSLQSARSSLSNQSSYVTAADSTSSISTLQDEKHGEQESSDDNYWNANTSIGGSYTMPLGTTPRNSFEIPDDTPRGSATSTESRDDKVRKHQSLTLPALTNTEEMFQKVTKKPEKKRWKVFSLRRKN